MKTRLCMLLLLLVLPVCLVGSARMGSSFDQLAHRKAEISKLDWIILKYQVGQLLYYKTPKYPSFEGVYYCVKEQKLKMRFDIEPAMLKHYKSKQGVLEMLEWVKEREFEVLPDWFPGLELEGRKWLDIEFSTSRLEGQKPIASYRDGRWNIWQPDAIDPKKQSQHPRQLD